MTPKTSVWLVTSALLMFATQAHALDVYLNGVLITGVRDQEFENATVRLDAQGNVRIDAPHYQVEREDRTDRGPGGSDRNVESSPVTPRSPTIAPQRPSSSPDGPPARGGAGLSRRYWLVSQVNGPGMVQYRIEVRINGRLVRAVDDTQNLAPIEVTEYLRSGNNTVRVTAIKLTEGGRRSESSRHWMRVVVADGHIEGTSVVIDRPGVIFTRNAAQTDRVSRDFTLEAE